MILRHRLFILLSFLLFISLNLTINPLYAQSSKENVDVKDIIQKAEELMRGTESSVAEIKMTIVRPDWTREMQLKSWSKGQDYSLILVTAPARDKGTAFLKREKEMWNWQPTIERTVKMPPSMMSQSWMGSDFTNDDLVRQASIIEDYTHKLLDMETIEERTCYKIELVPNEGVAVVWGKVIMWVDKEDYLQLKTEFYDEDDYLVNTMLGKNIKEMNGRTLPTRMEVIPAEEEGNKTIIDYISLEFDKPMKDKFFSQQNMKRLR